jgi:Ser/Thr protein kinase RdoA (MazF antagonist)
MSPSDSEATDTARDVAVEAAVRAAIRYGYTVEQPIVIQETNNVVVWLRPHRVIAKVGRWSHSTEPLVREHMVASFLTEGGAPIAPPVPRTKPFRDEATGFVITLWERLDVDAGEEIDAADVGQSLRTLHEHLDRFDGELPSFRGGVELARRALDDDQAMAALPVEDRALLRQTIDRLLPKVDAFDFLERQLHGEPHLANVLATPAGLRWIDLENVCLGPLEWDLAFLPDESVSAFDTVDAELLKLLRVVNSAVVGTWCWVRVDVEGILWHARYHLQRVRDANR